MLDEAETAYLAAIDRGDTTAADRLVAVLDAATALEQQRDQPVRGAILAEALDLAACGVPVFPLGRRSKFPAIPNTHAKTDPPCRAECGRQGHGLYDATTDAAVIRDWWRQYPHANVGIRTGVAFDVVDLDGPRGIAALYNGAAPVVDTLEVLGIARTPRAEPKDGRPGGGRHLFVPVTGLGCKTDLYPGVDYRGQGGYVVAAPSVASSGVRYEWVIHPMRGSVKVAA